MKKIIIITFLFVCLNIFSFQTDKMINLAIQKANSCNLNSIVKEINNIQNGRYRVDRVIRGKSRYLLFVKNNLTKKNYIYIIKKC